MYCLFIIVDERDDDRVTETVDIVRRLESKCRYIDIIIDYIITSREQQAMGIQLRYLADSNK